MTKGIAGAISRQKIPKCRNFQSGIGAILPVKLKEVCGRLAVQKQTHAWKRQTGHIQECQIFQKQWTVSANHQTICCDVELCANERGVFLNVGYNLSLMGGGEGEAGLWKIFSTNSDLKSFLKEGNKGKWRISAMQYIKSMQECWRKAKE